jgi:mRNA-degrading endonuclease RelE of RelBE toxin-antitoxin system
VRVAVLETHAAIKLDPEAMGKRLVGRKDGLWAVRVGSYRVLDALELAGVIVRSIRHRNVAYRPGRRRRRS